MADDHKHDKAKRGIEHQTVGNETVTVEVKKCSKCGRTMERRIIKRKKN